MPKSPETSTLLAVPSINFIGEVDGRVGTLIMKATGKQDSTTCVINCDNIITIPLEDLDDQPIGHLDEITRARLDEALRYSLDIMY